MVGATRYRAGDAAAAWSVIWIAAMGCLAQVVPSRRVPDCRPGTPAGRRGVGAAAVCALWITGGHPAPTAPSRHGGRGSAAVRGAAVHSLAPSSIAAGTLAWV
ncbi:hypothetical protein I553_3817 [Mycobacterium xenopi 4042]|uniref:Uncharacterized protein n=1 Tax=Mycobacterium xenopi 4042 TaxID=1299334 RepID=X7ZZ86_MYCXE|nr:hypothetical protein I553_3817 [Mycobacterium xenopi 4042]